MTDESICLEELMNKTIKLDCGHKYHYNCILKINNNSCPLCRSKILKMLIYVWGITRHSLIIIFIKNGECIICGYYSYVKVI